MKVTNVVLLLLLLPFAIATSSDSPTEISQSEAVAVAIKAMGLDDMKGCGVEPTDTAVERVTIADSTTPLLNLNGHDAYRIRIDDVPVSVDTVCNEEFVVTYSRSFDVFVDPETRTILKITSTLPSYHDKMMSGEIRRPTRSEVENNLAEKGISFVCAVSETPSPGFLQAIRETLNGRGADQITGYYVEYEDRHFVRRHLWVIETCGAIPLNAATYMRTLVDESGMLYSTNTPVPSE